MSGATIPSGVEELIRIFEQELSEISFPDVNAMELSALRVEVEERTEMVKHARATLERAMVGLDDAVRELNKKADVGLSYAKVFAQGKENLEERLNAITLSRETVKPLRSEPNRVSPPAVKTSNVPKSSRSSRKTNADAMTVELPFVDDDSAVSLAELPTMF